MYLKEQLNRSSWVLSDSGNEVYTFSVLEMDSSLMHAYILLGNPKFAVTAHHLKITGRFDQRG